MKNVKLLLLVRFNWAFGASKRPSKRKNICFLADPHRWRGLCAKSTRLSERAHRTSKRPYLIRILLLTHNPNHGGVDPRCSVVPCRSRCGRAAWLSLLSPLARHLKSALQARPLRPRAAVMERVLTRILVSDANDCTHNDPVFFTTWGELRFLDDVRASSLIRHFYVG